MSALVSSAVPAKRFASISRALDALLDGQGVFSGVPIRELLVGDARHVEMNVDTLQQRSANPLLGYVVHWRLTRESTQT
jgi:hypothetical protein